MISEEADQRIIVCNPIMNELHASFVDKVVVASAMLFFL